MIHKINEKNGIRFIICSETGSNHIKDNVDNQDSALSGFVSDSCWFLAVADGVSSVKYGRVGSQVAVQTVKWLAEQIELDNLKMDETNEIRTSFVRKWKSNFEDSWNEYASTVNFAIGSKNRLLVGQIGDGLILVKAGEKECILGETEDFYSTETYALGTAVIRSSFSLELIDVEDRLSIVMMSDGVGKEIEPENRMDVLEYIAKLATDKSTNAQKEVEQWIRELSERNGDDKTIGIMVGSE